MELNTQKFALAATQTAGILYVACAAFVAIAPIFAMMLLGWLAHVTNTEALAREVSIKGAFFGFVQVVVYVYISAFLFAWLYNRLIRQG